jgi:hypothetical protein
MLPVVRAREAMPCSYRTKCESFIDALVWLQQNIQGSDRVAILTDSLSPVMRLEQQLMLVTWWEVVRMVIARIHVCI